MMRPTAVVVLDEARKYLGVHEGRDQYGQWDNITQFGQAYGWNGVPWCQIYIWYIFAQTGGSDLVLKTASCAEEWSWFKRARRARRGNYPQVGALIYFGPDASEHVGIVEHFDADHVTYISGNTSDGTTSDGNSVQRKVIARWSTRIWGYAYPEYAPAGPRPRPGSTRVWKVKRGQTLSGIAAAVGMTLSALLGANPSLAAHPDRIFPGERVTIPAQPPTPHPTTVRPTTARPSQTIAPCSSATPRPKPRPMHHHTPTPTITVTVKR